MAKRNHYPLAALKHDGRLHDAVIRTRKDRRPNAPIHGLFAQALIIPGEDLREFSASVAQLGTA